MPEQPAVTESTESPRQLNAWTRRLIAACVLFAGLLLILWNSFPAPTINAPLTLVRDADGSFQSDGKLPAGSPQVHAGRIDAKNSLTAANSSSHGTGARHCYRQVLLICKSHDALSQRVAADLLTELQKSPHFTEIKFVPPGHPLPTSGRGPDLFVQLELQSLSESGIVDHQVDARFRVRWGNSLTDSSHSHVDTHTPPLVQSHTNAQLEHRSTTREIASSAAKYKLVAADIAGQLAGAMTKEIDANVAKDGLLPDLPAEFYSAYHEPPALPLEDFHSQLVFSGSGLFKHNETVWQCRGETPLGESLAAFRERLVAAGYACGKRDGPLTYLRATKDAHIVEAYADRASVLDHKTPDERARQDRQFVVTHTERATLEECQAALDQLLDEKADFTKLMMFEHFLSQEQNQRLLERFEASPTQTAEGWKWAAWRYHRNHDARTREAIENAVLLLPLAPLTSNVEASLKSLAKELGDEALIDTLKKQPLDIERAKRLGFVELVLEDLPVSIEFDAGDSARLIVPGSDEAWNFLVCSVVEVGSGATKRYELQFSSLSPRASSQVWGQTVTPQATATHSTTLDDKRSITLSVKQLPGKPRFELSVSVLPAPTENAVAAD